ncbi:hypothetical protein SE18_12040 [Herpetosiphon geysericola]|uniref:Uncharacterized protein n=1 Tax=Herpetosiphon geysericola TaxID=70996 RepID=A0A0P6YT97_9CHLR|nr:hypothetical protein SE18_12040 [Herpetosiphon geysericola]
MKGRGIRIQGSGAHFNAAAQRYDGYGLWAMGFQNNNLNNLCQSVAKNNYHSWNSCNSWLKT